MLEKYSCKDMDEMFESLRARIDFELCGLEGSEQQDYKFSLMDRLDAIHKEIYEWCKKEYGER